MEDPVHVFPANAAGVCLGRGNNEAPLCERVHSGRSCRRGENRLPGAAVEALLGEPTASGDRENPNLVMFLRGDGIAPRTEMSLFRDLAEKMGIAVEGTVARGLVPWRLWNVPGAYGAPAPAMAAGPGPGSALILVLDALNEAPYAERIIREALDMVGVAACFPWCKVVFSIRQEWMSLWAGKMGLQEAKPLEELRPFFHLPWPGWAGCRTGGARRDEGPPVVMLEPFSEAQAEEVYRRYQRASGSPRPASGYRIPACRHGVGELNAETRNLLVNPLHLHLFMESLCRSGGRAGGERAASSSAGMWSGH